MKMTEQKLARVNGVLLRVAQAPDLTIRCDQTRAKTTPTPISISSLNAAKGPRITSQLPPSPKMDNQIGRTQQDAESVASIDAMPSAGVVQIVAGRCFAICSFELIGGRYIL